MHDNAWSLPQSALMERAYGDRFQLVEGLSNETVPRWASGDRVRCDALFVDGAKHLEPRLEDLRNFRSITPAVRTYIDASGLVVWWCDSCLSSAARAQGAPVFYDEATTLACVRGEAPEKSCQGHFGATMAYNRASREGWLRVVDCRWSSMDQAKHARSYERDGSCVAEYTSTARNAHVI